jgi:hypothetical protein
MSTNSVSSSNVGNNAVNYIDSIDLSKYPELAQKVAAMNQVGLNYIESLVLETTQQAQGAFLSASIGGGFDSSNETTLFGGVEAGMGIVQAGAAGYQIKKTADNISDISKLQENTNAARAELASQAKSEGNSITQVKDVDTSLQSSTGDQISVQEEDPGAAGESPSSFKKSGIKLKSEKEIDRDHETEMEKIRSANAGAQNTAQLIQSGSQLLQFPAQAAQANSQVAQTKQSAMNNNFSAAQSAAQSANQTLQQGLQLDPFAQNVASSRA